MNTNVLRAKMGGGLLVFLLLALVLPSWLIQNDRVINVDEPRWIVRGANFYYAVTHGEFDKTIFEYHPGVTNMWIVATAMHIYFPEYRGQGQGYFDPLKQKFEEFMRKNDKEALELVRISRYIHAGVLAATAVVALILLSRLVGSMAALLGMVLAVVSPFYLGHSRLMNLEGMLSLFVLVSFLGLQVYLNKERRLVYLLVSGAAFGLAQLTKSSSIVVIGLAGLMIFVGLFKPGEYTIKAKVWDAIKVFFIWFGAAALVYFVLWPGMWVAPGKMLAEVYGNALSYAFQGARLDVTEDLSPDGFSLDSGLGGVLHFIKAWASSSTPVTWLGLILVVFFLLKKGEKVSQRSTHVYLLILGVLFILMFGFAQGRDSQHYILSSYVAFDILAGMGWAYFLRTLQERWEVLNRPYFLLAALLVLTSAQISFGLPYAPYYFNYKAPLASVPATYGYGEGYSEAADYLAQKPNAGALRAYVYNGMGTFSYFFPGETILFKRVYILDDDFETISADMHQSDYLVLYPIVREKQPETEKILAKLEGVVEPEKVIYIHGLEYLQIYRIADIPEEFYQTLGRP
ncbi:MAG TPA: glycosyltransferase family 39 protein [Anaerolineales bacterium]|nr:glycosyltransferase family 39 protein [Anaerolineales bacterium]